MVENNDFKQLPHISLAFRAGTDAAVKQFLAFRLGELRSDCGQLSAELEHMQERAGCCGGRGCGPGRRAAARIDALAPPHPHACPLYCPPSQSERNSLQNSLGEARRAQAAAREAHERHLLEHEAQLQAAEAAAAEARVREVAEVRDAALRWGGGRRHVQDMQGLAAAFCSSSPLPLPCY